LLQTFANNELVFSANMLSSVANFAMIGHKHRIFLQAFAKICCAMNMNENQENKIRNVTIVDVAEAADVSYSTVSRVLNGYPFVKDSTRKRVLQAAEILGYVPNQQARSLAGGKTTVIGLLVPGLDNGYIGEIARGIDEELTKAHYDLMLYTTHRQSGKETAYVNTITSGLTAGLILVVPLVSTSYLDALHERKFPIVLIDQIDTTGKSSTVDATNWQGSYEATNYLIELGHRRIGIITGLMDIRSAVDRLDGYKAALQDNGLAIDDSLIVAGDFWQFRGYHAAKELLELSQRPTAILASNDLTAFGAMEAIRDYGLEIPNDISVIGFDDIPQARIVHPKLTTVRQPLDQMGRLAVKLLLERIKDPTLPPKHITLSTHLVVRESCQRLTIT
jgi:LacI family transcriptional regulator